MSPRDPLWCKQNKMHDCIRTVFKRYQKTSAGKFNSSVSHFSETRQEGKKQPKNPTLLRRWHIQYVTLLVRVWSIFSILEISGHCVRVPKVWIKERELYPKLCIIAASIFSGKKTKNKTKTKINKKINKNDSLGVCTLQCFQLIEEPFRNWPQGQIPHNRETCPFVAGRRLRRKWLSGGNDGVGAVGPAGFF